MVCLFALALAAAPPGDTLTARDSAAIVSAALTLTLKPDSPGAEPTIRLQGDTATVTVWLSRAKGQRVRIERRAGRWVGVRSDTTTLLRLRSAPSP